MPTEHLKTPFGWRANELATKRALDAIQGSGRALPASVVSGNGSIVTVKFELQSEFTLPQVRVPVATSEYFRAPLQPGCKGVVVSSDYYLGGVSGIGGGVATTTKQSNLGALIFVPIGTTSFMAVPDDRAVVYGPAGATIMTQSGSTKIEVTASGVTITLTTGNVTIVGGDVVADGISLKHHVHGGVEIGGGQTGEPVT
jgi:hypothetical protein